MIPSLPLCKLPCVPARLTSRVCCNGLLPCQSMPGRLFEMVKLKRITVSGFRGILAPLTIDLTQGGQPRSVVVYGRNGTGKSSLTDAWEWLRTGKIDHLAREGAGATAYPHFASPDGNTFVEVEFTDPTLGTLRLVYDSDRVTRPVVTGSFAALNALTPHPCHIRFADLGNFVFRTKTERYDYLAQLMGLSPQVELQKALRRVERQLQEELLRRRQVAERLEAELAGKVGEVPRDIAELVALLLPRFERHGVVASPPEASFREAVEHLRHRVERDSLVQRHANLRSLGTAIKLVRPDPALADYVERYSRALAPLRAHETVVKELHLIDLYSRGLRSVDPTKPDTCPLCGQRFPGNLKSHINSELGRLAALKQAYDTAEAARQGLRGALRGPVPASEPVREALGPLSAELWAPEVEQLLRSLLAGVAAGNAIRPLCDKPVQDLSAADCGQLMEWGNSARLHASAAADLRTALLARLATEFKTLEADHSRSQLAEDYEVATYALGIWPKVVHARHHHATLSAVQARFTSILERYAEACIADVQQRFAAISEDLTRFFAVLEQTAEGLSDPVLKILPDQDRSVVLEIGFHGNTVSPAYKYLSESQLNTFGLAVFLASVRRFNPQFGFILLDDVVNSLDGYKRPRLLALLRQHFADYQILLLTHDNVWRDRIARELPSWKRFHFKRLDVGVGPVVADLRSSMEQVDELIAGDNPRVAGQVLGPNMEDELQDLCEAFEAQVTYNRRNEYTLEPLLAAFTQRTTKKLGPSHPLALALVQLQAETGFRNLCAHAKNPEIDLSTEEMMVVSTKWKVVLALARCREASCAEIPRWRDPDFRCGCGATVLSRV